MQMSNVLRCLRANKIFEHTYNEICCKKSDDQNHEVLMLLGIYGIIRYYISQLNSKKMQENPEQYYDGLHSMKVACKQELLEIKEDQRNPGKKQFAKRHRKVK